MGHVSLNDIFQEAAGFEDQNLKQTVETIWNKLLEESRWGDAALLPVSSHMPEYSHIIHNRSVVKMAMCIAGVLEEVHGIKVNRDYLFRNW